MDSKFITPKSYEHTLTKRINVPTTVCITKQKKPYVKIVISSYTKESEFNRLLDSSF